MNKRDVKLTALLFNECINSRNLAGLTALMTGNYTFIDSGDSVHKGKEKMTKGWEEYFNSYPDYRNIFTHLESRDQLVIMTGYSTCSNCEALDGPAIWTAKIRDDKVTEWRVYLDTPENRSKLQIKSRKG